MWALHCRKGPSGAGKDPPPRPRPMVAPHNRLCVGTAVLDCKVRADPLRPRPLPFSNLQECISRGQTDRFQNPWPSPMGGGGLPARTQPQGRRGGGGALQTPKWLYGSMDFVGARGAGDFLLGRGNFFLFYPMCLYSKYPEFCGEFKNG